MTDIAKFNVGGQHYEVSRSLLQSHPDTMLAKSASDQWQEDPESEIFIERDGARFRFVMDYLRDGNVTLPITETKEAFVAELEYYNIATNVDTIRQIAGAAAATSSLRDAVNWLKESTMNCRIQYLSAEIAMFCFERFFLQKKSIEREFTATAGVQSPHYTVNGGKECYNGAIELQNILGGSSLLGGSSHVLILDNVNHFLKDLGLELQSVDHNYGYTGRGSAVFDFVIKVTNNPLMLEE